MNLYFDISAPTAAQRSKFKAAQKSAEAFLVAAIRPGQFDIMYRRLRIKTICGRSITYGLRAMPVIWHGWARSGYWPDFQSLN